MILDAYNLYSDSQAVTASAASTNQIDHGAVRDLGTGENMFVVCTVVVAMTDSGSNSTITVTLETDDNSSFSSATTGMTLGTFAAVSAIGTTLFARLAPGSVNERYTRLYYTTANGDLTTGSFDGYLCKDLQRFVAYADGLTIS